LTGLLNQMLTNPLWIFKGLLSKTLPSISFTERLLT
jgi:hypothetical protein